MRIISDFNDYYDIGVAYGIDPNIVYHRKKEEVDEQTVKQLFNVPSHEEVSFRNVVNKIFKQEVVRFLDMLQCIHLIGFCGKWYVVFETSQRNQYGQTESVFVWHWSAKLDDDIEQHNRYTKQYKQTIKKLLSLKPEEDMKPFIELNAPIIHITSNRYGVRLTKNSCLKQFNFASVVDPWSAFQEIDMFVSGILGQPQPNTDDISDENLRDAKGFDTMSFKKPKEKSK